MTSLVAIMVMIDENDMVIDFINIDPNIDNEKEKEAKQ